MTKRTMQIVTGVICSPAAFPIAVLILFAVVTEKLIATHASAGTISVVWLMMLGSLAFGAAMSG